jgi:hypothetical protein
MGGQDTPCQMSVRMLLRSVPRCCDRNRAVQGGSKETTFHVSVLTGVTRRTYMADSSARTHEDSCNVLYQLTGNKTGKCVEDLYCLSPFGMNIKLKNHCKILYLKYNHRKKDLVQILRYGIFVIDLYNWPPLWSSGQSFWLQIQRSRVRFPALPDFLRSSGSGTGFTQPREGNWGASWRTSSGSGVENRD